MKTKRITAAAAALVIAFSASFTGNAIDISDVPENTITSSKSITDPIQTNGNGFDVIRLDEKDMRFTVPYGTSMNSNDNAELTVTNGGVLDISGELSLGKSCKINISNGGLVIVSGKLTSECTFEIGEGGRLELTQNAVFENKGTLNIKGTLQVGGTVTNTDDSSVVLYDSCKIEMCEYNGGIQLPRKDTMTAFGSGDIIDMENDHVFDSFPDLFDPRNVTVTALCPKVLTSDTFKVGSEFEAGTYSVPEGMRLSLVCISDSGTGSDDQFCECSGGDRIFVGSENGSYKIQRNYLDPFASRRVYIPDERNTVTAGEGFEHFVVVHKGIDETSGTIYVAVEPVSEADCPRQLDVSALTIGSELAKGTYTLPDNVQLSFSCHPELTDNYSYVCECHGGDRLEVSDKNGALMIQRQYLDDHPYGDARYLPDEPNTIVTKEGFEHFMVVRCETDEATGRIYINLKPVTDKECPRTLELSEAAAGRELPEGIFTAPEDYRVSFTIQLEDRTGGSGKSYIQCADKYDAFKISYENGEAVISGVNYNNNNYSEEWYTVDKANSIQAASGYDRFIISQVRNGARDGSLEILLIPINDSDELCRASIENSNGTVFCELKGENMPFYDVNEENRWINDRSAAYFIDENGRSFIENITFDRDMTLTPVYREPMRYSGKMINGSSEKITIERYEQNMGVSYSYTHSPSDKPIDAYFTDYYYGYSMCIHTEKAGVRFDFGEFNSCFTEVLDYYSGRYYYYQNKPISELVTVKDKIVEHLAGDVNIDGKVDILDVIVIKKYIQGAQNVVNPAWCDVTADGVVDEKDAERLNQYIVGYGVDIY